MIRFCINLLLMEHYPGHPVSHCHDNDVFFCFHSINHLQYGIVIQPTLSFGERVKPGI